jgi:CubicO group peptidase (beta-lactamase class C family)
LLEVGRARVLSGDRPHHPAAPRQDELPTQELAASTRQLQSHGGNAATGMSRRAGWSLMGHRRGHAAVSAPRPGWRWVAAVVVACLLAAGCSGGGQQRGRSTATSRPAAVPAQRDYWPTAGWRTAPPAAVGMDPKLVADLDAKAAYHPQLRSLLVIRHGELVYERYWHGDAHTGQEAFSVTKSFTAALVGIALGDHQLKGLDQTVGALLARHLPAGADPRLVKVTVGQLLTMTSGLAGDDMSQGGDPGLMQRLQQSRDWVRHILGRKLATTPGTTFAYSNASSHLLSAIVADATGQSTLAYARARLFSPLGIHTEHALVGVDAPNVSPALRQAYERAEVAWPTDPQGYHTGFSGLKLPSRDLAKLGYLYLNGGRWDGVQVIPADYVRASTRRQSVPPPAAGVDGYGYQWWVTTEHGHPSFVAVGYGGQFVQVIPDLDLVVVITSDAANRRWDAENLIGEAIIPAATH